MKSVLNLAQPITAALVWAGLHFGTGRLILGAWLVAAILFGCGGKPDVGSNSTGAASSAASTALTDQFALTQFYPSAVPAVEWNSQHWGVGGERLLAPAVGTRDSTDPSGWSTVRGSGSPQLQIMGDGRMQMLGGQPRLYISPYPTSSSDPNLAEHLFVNVEFSGYFRRLSPEGAAYGGFVVGLRSGPEGHGSNTGDDCDATTYYSRIRNDGQWQFEKELKHPASSVVLTKPLWPDAAPLPVGQWIGMKYVVYTTNEGSVRLQAWVDFSEGVDGGQWQLLGDFVDDGDWNRHTDYGEVDATGCPYSADNIIAPGGGVVFIRNSDGVAEYKWITIREIKPF